MIIFPLFSDWALLIFRVFLGALFIAHGWPKLKNWKGTKQWFQSAGFKPGWFWATVVGLVEFLGGIALIFGFLTRLVALLLALQFLTIVIWKIFRKEKFVGGPAGAGWEFDLVLLGAMLVLLTVGGGAYAWGPSWFGF